MNDVYALSMIADLERLEELRAFVEANAQRLGVHPPALYDVLLAVNEMATNIVVHGYAGQPGALEVELRREGEALVVRLTDRAPPFDPTRAPVPDTTTPPHLRPPGGMGIHVTRRFMDSMSHRILAQGGNELTLIKYGVMASGR
jgi:serine/threonine-protein kinase RsbW